MSRFARHCVPAEVIRHAAPRFARRQRARFPLSGTAVSLSIHAKAVRRSLGERGRCLSSRELRLAGQALHPPLAGSIPAVRTSCLASLALVCRRRSSGTPS
jgi:hypothetical protein